MVLIRKRCEWPIISGVWSFACAFHRAVLFDFVSCSLPLLPPLFLSLMSVGLKLPFHANLVKTTRGKKKNVFCFTGVLKSTAQLHLYADVHACFCVLLKHVLILYVHLTRFRTHTAFPLLLLYIYLICSYLCPRSYIYIYIFMSVNARLCLYGDCVSIRKKQRQRETEVRASPYSGGVYIQLDKQH